MRNKTSLLDFKKEAYPNWYWKNGICDATVKKIKHFDYMAENNIYRNCLRIELDSHNALFENDIIAIELYDYKELYDGESVEGF